MVLYLLISIHSHESPHVATVTRLGYEEVNVERHSWGEAIRNISFKTAMCDMKGSGNLVKFFLGII